MSRRLSIIYTIIALAITSAASGCSSASTPIAGYHAGSESNHAESQARGSWRIKAPMLTARGSLAAGVAHHFLFAIGGVNSQNAALSTVEAYNPEVARWQRLSPMRTARSNLAVGVVIDRPFGLALLYAVGGDAGRNTALSTLEAYDFDRWTTKASMPTARWGLAAGVVNGILYAVGGSPGSGYLSTVEAYDPSTDTWTTKAPMPTARCYIAAGVLNGILYVVGGQNAPFQYLNTVEAYDPATDTWTTKAPMPTARQLLAVGVMGGRLYAIGGYDGDKLATVEAYNPATDSWAEKTPMPVASFALAVGVVTHGNHPKLYGVGGSDNINWLNTLQAFNPQ